MKDARTDSPSAAPANAGAARADTESARRTPCALLELLREVLVEEARDDGQVRAQSRAASSAISRFTGSRSVTARRARASREARLAQEPGIARVAHEDGRARGLRDAPPLGPRVLRDDDGALAEAAEELDDADPDVPEAADEDGRRPARRGAERSRRCRSWSGGH